MIDKGGILVIDDFIDKDYQEDIKMFIGKENGKIWHFLVSY